MHTVTLAVLSVTFLASSVLANENLISVPSAHPAKAAMNKLEGIAQARGLKVFARLDHAAGAKSIGETLRPTELLIFGHPKGGTPLLQCSQSYGIDLPLHVLAWEDSTGKIWPSYKDLSKLGHQHPAAHCDAALKRLNDVLEGLVKVAAKD